MSYSDLPGEGSSRRSFLRAIGVLGSTALFGVAGADDGSAGGPSDDGELVVGIDSRVSVADAEPDIEKELPSGSEITRKNDPIGFMSVKLPDNQARTQASVSRALESRSDVAYVEPNATYKPLVQPDDLRFDQQYAPQQVNAPEAWETTFGSSDVTIAVVDQGADYEHPDLNDQFGSTVGRDFLNNDSDPMPDRPRQETHGTHVSGIASGTTNNGTGIAGMSNSTLLSCRCLSTEGGSLAAIADGIQWATDQGADLINMSLGGGGPTETLRTACQYALNNGALPVAAAGNNGSRGVSYPAGYDSVVAVSAVDSSENLARFSQYGPNIDVAAPGVQVYSTVPNGSYQNMSGTSMACPAAVGVAALGLAADPSLSAEELKQLLKQTARDIGLSDEQQGAGLVDAAALVDAAGDGGDDNTGPTASASASPTSAVVDESIEFDASGSSDPDGTISSYEWVFDNGASADGAAVTHSYGAAGEYTATVTVTDDDGASDTASVTVSVESDGGGGSCDAPAWDSRTTYTSGDRVTHNGSLWEAKWWNQNYEPGANQWGPWEKVKDCGDDGDDNDGGDDGDGNCDAPAWDYRIAYSEGDQVSYDGSLWEAKWWNQNYEPGASRWGPWKEVKSC
ncbi:S8 family serine peptidase [Halorhabdus rudnickae]|uniref:S8 family serine peptidase n=1 Tax=Halorhabdus rudnickae TaxID=1775544 RepID=UPI0014386519|nr:S8 family serine peptidase [Halorhabdus rudnickae]